MEPRARHPIDVHVGSRIRLRRMQLGMSQEKLGQESMLTFQQIQKYEKGTNRVSASRLAEFAKALDVPIEFFFNGAPDLDTPPRPLLPYEEFLRTRDGVRLATAFSTISDETVQRALVEIVEALASHMDGKRSSA